MLLFITYIYVICQHSVEFGVFGMENIVVSIKKRPSSTDPGYKIFSIRIKNATVEALDSLAEESNRSRNDIINLILEFGVKNCKIVN